MDLNQLENPALPKITRRWMKVVQNRVQELVTCHGYSHQRAALALLQELQEAGSTPPVEIIVHHEEVVNTMRRYKLGSEQARQVLTVAAIVKHVSDKFKQSPSTGKCPEASAVDALSHQLSEANLSCREGTCGTTTERPIAPLSRPDSASILPPSSRHTVSSLHSKRSMSERARATSFNGASIKNSRPSSPSSSPTLRKRSLDETLSPKVESSSTSSTPPARARADSVSEAVSAKLSDHPASAVAIPAVVVTTGKDETNNKGRVPAATTLLKRTNSTPGRPESAGPTSMVVGNATKRARHGSAEA